MLLMSGTFSALASILLRIAGVASMRNGAAALSLLSFDRVMMFRGFALCSYAGGFVMYALALRRIPLSIAYPLMVGVTILEVLLFGFVTGETLSMRTIFGSMMLVASLVVLYMPA